VNVLCATNAEKNRYDVKECFQIVGYPEWWGDRPRHEGRGAGRGSGRQGMSNQGTQARALEQMAVM